MKLVLIADTHGLHEQVKLPKGDILVCAGDISNVGKIGEIGRFNKWLGRQSFEHKIVIAGNHDWVFEKQPSLARSMITNGIYLQDESVEVNGLKFYGSPWQPKFMGWAFNLDRGPALAKKWVMIPDDTDILVTHCGPRGILDRIINGEALGCDDLLEKVMQVRPKLHIFGHIHDAYGIRIYDSTTFINASICNESYNPINLPIVFEV